MKRVNYIFVNETGSENAARNLQNSHVSEIRQCVVVNGTGLSVSAGEQHKALLFKLCRLRRHYTNAKILGVSEVDPTSAHAPIRVNPAMNALRREMSDLP